MLVEFPDTQSQFPMSGSQPEDRRDALSVLCSSWDRFASRQDIPDAAWMEGLSQYLEHIVGLRVDHVQEWLTQNLSRFQTGHASIEELRRMFENEVVDFKGNVRLCKVQCANCQLLCIQNRFHDGQHDCATDHRCAHKCAFCQEGGELKNCTVVYVFGLLNLCD